MKITIELPEDIVVDTANAVWRAEFTADYQNTNRRRGYCAVSDAVRDHLLTPEVIAAIRESVCASYKAQHEGIVRDVVAEELRKLVKKVVREQKDERKLL